MKPAREQIIIEGRNAVLEALRSGREIEKVTVLGQTGDGALSAIVRDIKKQSHATIEYADRRKLDAVSVTGRHQGIIACINSYNYASVEDILANASGRGEDPFVFILDGIEDPHNLGAIIRTANLSGAHGVIIRQDRAAGLTAAVARTSAGAVNYTPVARVTNIPRTIDALKKKGLWFVCADMGGELMYRLSLSGPLGMVIGSEGSGVSELVRKKCDMTASIPMAGDIDSLNASVAAGVLAWEIVRQRRFSSI